MTVALFAHALHAEIHTETIEYKQGEVVLQGYVAYDAKLAAKRPGIVLVHDWMGMGPFVKKKAEEIAAMGYTVFAADIYGKDVHVKDSKEAAEQATKYKSDRNLLRDRVKAAYDELQKHKTVDKRKMAAMGYCFGGTTALELARSGADLKGVVSFHGGLDTPTPADARNVKAKVLVLHGSDDPFVPPAQVAAFEKEMGDAKVDFKIVKYPGAVHAFMVPDAGNDNSKGAAYNAEAAEKATLAMSGFLKQTFKK